MLKRKIIVFARSRELNGIRELKNSLCELDSNFLKANDFLNLIKLLMFSKDVHCVFCLSSIDLMICIWISQVFKIKIPIILGVYHPKQIKVTLDGCYSSIQKRLFVKIFSKLPLDNIIFNSPPCFESAMDDFSFLGENKNIILCPSAKQKNNLGLKSNKLIDSGGHISVVTVSRYVDFKVCTILEMIDTLDRLNDLGYKFTYHIYGEGHLKKQIQEKINQMIHAKNYTLYDFLEPNRFNETILKYDLFYGMGYALTNSAMLQIPSLIAVQNEKNPLTYGFFSEYDHQVIPMFGDETKKYNLVSLEKKLTYFYKLTPIERNHLGKECRTAWEKAFDSNLLIPKMMNVFEQALVIEYEKIRFLDIVKIRLQKYWSRLTNKPRIDV